MSVDHAFGRLSPSAGHNGARALPKHRPISRPMNRFRLALLALVLFAFTLLVTACEGNGLLTPSKRLFVGPSLVDCVGVGPQKCLQVKERREDAWQLFYGGIEGFDWEPGYLYEITVFLRHVENPPADGSSIRYILIRIVSKTEVTLGPL
jgi:hypothetical protein